MKTLFFVLGLSTLVNCMNRDYFFLPEQFMPQMVEAQLGDNPGGTNHDIPSHKIGKENKYRISENIRRKIINEASLKARCLAFCADYSYSKKKNYNQIFSENKLKKVPKELQDQIKLLTKSLAKYDKYGLANDPTIKPLITDPALVESFLCLKKNTTPFAFEFTLRSLIQCASSGNQSSNISVLEYFFDYHKIDINTDLWSDSPLFWAVFSTNKQNTLWLLKHTANPNKKCESGQTVMHWAVRDACYEPSTDIIDLLLDYKTEINSLDDFDKTPLDRAQSPLIKKLLKERGGLTGAEVLAKRKEQNKDEEVQLLAYASVNNIEGVKQLLRDKTIDIDVQNEAGNTPLILATQSGYREMIRFLLEHGANKLIQNRFGQTAYDIAKEMHNDQLIMLLMISPDIVRLEHTIRFDPLPLDRDCVIS